MVRQDQSPALAPRDRQTVGRLRVGNRATALQDLGPIFTVTAPAAKEHQRVQSLQARVYFPEKPTVVTIAGAAP